MVIAASVIHEAIAELEHPKNAMTTIRTVRNILLKGLGCSDLSEYHDRFVKATGVCTKISTPAQREHIGFRKAAAMLGLTIGVTMSLARRLGWRYQDPATGSYYVITDKVLEYIRKRNGKMSSFASESNAKGDENGR